MTTATDDHIKRTQADQWGSAKENTTAIPVDGMADPTGEYPRRDYFFGNNTNKAARGAEVNTLWYGGSEPGVQLIIPPQRPSQYPLNQVQETTSGHVIEVDDTPGGERILLKHRTGAGVEVRADGTVIVSARSNRIEVAGGDHTTIVEGDGNLVYKGNLTVKVTGDFNVECGGDYNVTAAGSYNESIRGSVRSDIGGHYENIVAGDRDIRSCGSSSELVLGNRNVSTKGAYSNVFEGDGEICAGHDLFITAENAASISAQIAAMAAGQLSVIGSTGTIGGELMRHYGSVYSGPAGGTGNETTFYGSLIGLALEATTAEFAKNAEQSHSSIFADWANGAAAAVTAPDGPGPGAPPTDPAPDYKMNMDWTQNPSGVMPTGGNIGAHLLMTQYGIRNVQVDDQFNSIRNNIIRHDDYNNVFRHDPTPAEVRAKMRDPANRNNSDLTGILVAEGRLDKSHVIKSPIKPGRLAGQAPSPQYGTIPLGNNPLDNKSKRFTPRR